MVDLGRQYQKIKSSIDKEILNVIDKTDFIKGMALFEFEKNLGSYLDGASVIGCANGTDALQIALMALGLKRGDEVIVPSFTYVATVEVIALLGLTPVLVDVHSDTFNIDLNGLDEVITDKTKAIIPVHLYGQAADMDKVLSFARKHNLFVVEDSAQGIGGTIKIEGINKKLATIGDIGCLSFFPSKNLGCYGDGGALVTKNKQLAHKIRMIANHGQEKKYHHDIVGINSRLDTIQSAILNVKLPQLEGYNNARRSVAKLYDQGLSDVLELETPVRNLGIKHVFHQYTVKVKNDKRDQLKNYLKEKGIPSMIYYPLPVHKQKAYKDIVKVGGSLKNTDTLTKTVLSLPIHTEMDEEQQAYIIQEIRHFFNS